MSSEEEPLDYLYYVVGQEPVRVGCISGEIPVQAEILNQQTKEFEIDNQYIHIIASSLDVYQIEELEFRDLCLKRGAKAPPK